MEIVGVVLAGGLARRMGGGDKPLRPLAGRPILAHVIARFAAQVEALVINANGDAARFAGFGLPVVADTLPGHPGPLAGVLAGMRWAETHRPGASHVAVVPGDTPFLPLDLVARLAAALEGRAPGTIAIPVTAAGPQQVAALFPVALADDLEEDIAAGARRVLAWIEIHPVVSVAFDDAQGGDAFFNVNTPADLAEAERLAGGAAASDRSMQ